MHRKILHTSTLPEMVARKLKAKEGQCLEDILENDAWEDMEQRNPVEYNRACDDLAGAIVMSTQLNRGVYTMVIYEEIDPEEQHEYECSVTFQLIASGHIDAAKLFTHDVNHRGSIGDVQVRRVDEEKEVTVDTDTWTEVE